MSEDVLVRDLSSGRIHKRTRDHVGGPLRSYEACNADSAGDSEVITDVEFADVGADAKCKRCFPADIEGVPV